MSRSLPDESSRLRCGQCGNLTRFDVTRTVRSREYWHASLSGEVAVEEHEVLAEQVEAVTCRLCSASDPVEVVSRPEFGGPRQEPPGDGGV